MFFDEKIALFNQHCETQEDVFTTLAGEFIKKGVAKETFVQGLKDREAVFPTGLRLNNMGVAIPHTDIVHVNKAQIGFMTLDAPIRFREMGTEDQYVDVQVIFMLALKEPHQQLETLQALMALFMNDELMEKLQKVDNYEDYYQIIKESGLDN